jgi:membrane-bound lytic murein transglycosylase F
MTNVYDEAIKAAVAEHMPGYDWRLYKCQLIAESGLNPDAVSPVGAKGLAQFMPKTWIQIRNELNLPRYSSAFNSKYAIVAGAYYTNKLRCKWSAPRPEMDRHCLALASYNAGFGNMLEAQKCAGGVNGYREIIAGLYQVTGKHSNETTTYVKRILAMYVKLIVG